MLREQRELMSVQKGLVQSVEELKAGLEQLKAGVEGLKREGVDTVQVEEQLKNGPRAEWLTKAGVMDLLCISNRTFYRRLEEERWEKVKNGGTWYYLKASLYKTTP
jgi:hypothetical protein